MAANTSKASANNEEEEDQPNSLYGLFDNLPSIVPGAEVDEESRVNFTECYNQVCSGAEASTLMTEPATPRKQRNALIAISKLTSPLSDRSIQIMDGHVKEYLRACTTNSMALLKEDSVKTGNRISATEIGLAATRKQVDDNTLANAATDNKVTKLELAVGVLSKQIEAQRLAITNQNSGSLTGISTMPPVANAVIAPVIAAHDQFHEAKTNEVIKTLDDQETYKKGMNVKDSIAYMNTGSYMHKPQSGKTMNKVYDTNGKEIQVMWFDAGDKDHAQSGFYTFVPRQQNQPGTNSQQGNQSLYQRGNQSLYQRGSDAPTHRVPRSYTAHQYDPQQAAAAMHSQHQTQVQRACDHRKMKNANYCPDCGIRR